MRPTIRTLEAAMLPALNCFRPRSSKRMISHLGHPQGMLYLSFSATLANSQVTTPRTTSDWLNWEMDSTQSNPYEVTRSS